MSHITKVFTTPYYNAENYMITRVNDYCYSIPIICNILRNAQKSVPENVDIPYTEICDEK